MPSGAASDPRCAGGLVWQIQDLVPGAGWGVIDAAGRPKPAWYALRRAFRSQQVLITDEGLNGLQLHLLNETNVPLEARLRLTCLKDGTHPVREAEHPITHSGAKCGTSQRQRAVAGLFRCHLRLPLRPARA